MRYKRNFSYDEYTDNLIISSKAENEKVKYNFAFDNFVISITGRGKIVGLEIKDVSKVLEEMRMDRDLLENIKSASLIVTPKRDSIFIGFIIQGVNKENYMVPISYVPTACIAS